MTKHDKRGTLTRMKDLTIWRKDNYISIMLSSGYNTVLMTFWSNPSASSFRFKVACSLCHVLGIALCQEIILLIFLKTLLLPSSWMILKKEVSGSAKTSGVGQFLFLDTALHLENNTLNSDHWRSHFSYLLKV